MIWVESVASKCRYGDVAERLFGDAEIIWEHSEEDYQGFANVLAAMPDGRFAHYEWTYGSCSGCDEWEALSLRDDDIEKLMRDATAWFDSKEAVARYFRLEGEFAEAVVPTANDPKNGSIPGMLRYMSNDVGVDFQAMGAAFLAWAAKEVNAS